MGEVTAPGILVRRWGEILADPVLRDLPYKIELNAWGKIEMSPASNVHGRLQFWVGTELRRLLPEGEARLATNFSCRDRPQRGIYKGAWPPCSDWGIYKGGSPCSYEGFSAEFHR
jgi:hypothetical protein